MITTDEHLSFNQRHALYDLVGYCEGLAGSALVGELIERNLRIRIAAVLSTFAMPPACQRSEQQEYEAIVHRVCGAMTEPLDESGFSCGFGVGNG